MWHRNLFKVNGRSKNWKSLEANFSPTTLGNWGHHNPFLLLKIKLILYVSFLREMTEHDWGKWQSMRTWVVCTVVGMYTQHCVLIPSLPLLLKEKGNLTLIGSYHSFYV